MSSRFVGMLLEATLVLMDSEGVLCQMSLIAGTYLCTNTLGICWRGTLALDQGSRRIRKTADLFS